MNSRAADAAKQATDIGQLPRPDGRFWLPDAMVRKLRCSCYIKAVLLVLCSHADSFGESFPGIPLIAEESGMSARKARQALKEAEKLGLIFIKRANGTHSTYRVTDPEFWPLADSGSAESAACGAAVESKNGRTAAPRAALPRHVVPPKEDPRKEEKSKTRVSNPAGFDAFLEAYPDGYRKNKKEAFAVWRRLNPSKELIETILSALVAQKAGSDWLEGRGIPYPANWLKQERWLDEIPKPAPAKDPQGKAKGMTPRRAADERARPIGQEAPEVRQPGGGKADVEYYYSPKGNWHRVTKGRLRDEDEIVAEADVPDDKKS